MYEYHSNASWEVHFPKIVFRHILSLPVPSNDPAPRDFWFQRIPKKMEVLGHSRGERGVIWIAPWDSYRIFKEKYNSGNMLRSILTTLPTQTDLRLALHTN